ncbi:TPA: colicin E1 family microcin immunity protein [Klebsiella oxytoca]
MTLKYYVRHCFWGWCGYGCLIYFIVRDMNDGLIFPAYAPYMPFVVTYLVLSAILYPFSYYTSEKLALKIMTKPFWDRHIGVNSGVYGMFIILWLFCMPLSVPLFLVYLCIRTKTKISA